MATFEEASRAFMTWLSESRADINPKIKLEDLRHIQAGRGVVATQDIEQEELLFRIPRSAILSVENSILSNEIPATTFDNLGPWLSLILVMLYEYQNGAASNWAPYFNVLPSEFNTLMFWSDDQLAELQASAVRAKIGRKSADETFINELVPTIKEFAEIFFSGDPGAKERAEQMSEPDNLLLMHKMGSLIMAYAFDVEPANHQKEVDEEGYASEDEDEALPKGMVPMADMLNADADRNNARLFYEEEYLSMKALQPIKAGEEIFNDYGPLPRSDLLRRYGYITDNYIQYDVVEIPSGIVMENVSAAGIHSKQRLEYLDEHGVIDSGYDITASSPFDLQESLSPELIVLIETLLLPNGDFERLQRKGKLPKPENLTQQGAAFLHRLVQARIQQYPTSLEQDVQNYGGIPTTGEVASKERRYAMAKAVRIGEKTLLRDAEQALAQLADSESGVIGLLKRSAEDTEMGPGKKQRAN